MTVKITKINWISVGGKQYKPGDLISVTPGEEMTLNVHVYNSGLLPANPKGVFVGICPEGSSRWQETRVGDTTYIGPKGDEDHTYHYTLPRNLTGGYYHLGVRTSEMNYYVTTEIYVEAPIPEGMGRIKVITSPPGARAFIDGEPLENATPVAADVTPGQHTVMVELEGYKVKDISGADRVVGDAAVVSVSAGQVRTVTFLLEPTSPPLWKSAWFWGLAGLGLGTALVVAKRPEYARKAGEKGLELARVAKEKVPEYARRAMEAARPYVEKAKEATKTYAERWRK